MSRCSLGEAAAIRTPDLAGWQILDDPADRGRDPAGSCRDVPGSPSDRELPHQAGMKTVLSILVVLTACAVEEDWPPDRPRPTVTPDAGGGGGGDGGGGGGGASFDFSTPHPFGVGMTYDLAYSTQATTFSIDSSDPGIASVEPVPGTAKLVRLHGHAAGTVQIRAWKQGSTTPLDQVTVAVVPVDGVALQFRNAPGTTAPVTQLAALANSSDRIAVVYRAANGDPLAGRGTVAATGAITLATSDDSRLSDILGPPRVDITAGAAGAGALVVTLADDPRQFAFPIEIVTAPASYELALMVLGPNWTLVPPPPAIEAKELVGADIIGRTGDGRFVAGVRAVWSATAGLDLGVSSTTPNVGSEAIASAQAAGTYTLTATAGTTTLSRDLVIVPAMP